MILNASSLIWITRSGHAWVFNEFDSLIPPEVFEVILEGKKNNQPEAFDIEEAIEKNQIQVQEIKDQEELEFMKEMTSQSQMPLHPGEAEVLALARQEKDIAIIDESCARDIGELFQIKVKGIFYLFARLYQRNRINKQQLLQTLDDLTEAGFRLDPEDHGKVREEMENL